MLKQEQQKEGAGKEFLLVKEHPDLVKHISIFKQIMLPLELSCLGIAIEQQQPMATRAYYTALLFYTDLNEDKKKKLGFKYMFQRNLTTEDFAKIEKRLRGKKIKFPSYLKVQHTLERLEEWGILKRRYDDTKSNAAFYWIINPRFTILFEHKFKDIERMCFEHTLNVSS